MATTIVRKRGSAWTLTVDHGVCWGVDCLGSCPARRGGHRPRSWLPTAVAAPVTCPACGGPVSEPRQSRRKEHNSFATRRAATDARNRVLAANLGGDAVPDRNLTVDQWLTRWLDGMAVSVENGDLSPTSLEHYRGSVKLLVGLHDASGQPRPTLHSVALRSLATEQMEDVYLWLRRKGGSRGQGLARRTVQHAHSALRTALNLAVERGHLVRNPALQRTSVLGEREESKAGTKCWEKEETVAFLICVRDGFARDPGSAMWRLAPMWRLAATTGLRRGELLGLTWEAVDLDGMNLRVERQIIPAGKGLVVRPNAKTRSSHRTVPLDPNTVAMLRTWRGQQAAEQLAAGQAWTGTLGQVQGCGPAEEQYRLVFTDEAGGPATPALIRYWFRKAIDSVGVRPISLHQLRHGFASLALAGGAQDAAVAGVLGHSSPNTTRAIYRHVLQGEREAVTALVAGELDGHGAATASP